MSFLEPLPEMYGIWDTYFKRWECVNDIVFCTSSLPVALAQVLVMQKARERIPSLPGTKIVVRNFNEWAEKSADQLEGLIYNES